MIGGRIKEGKLVGVGASAAIQGRSRWLGFGGL